MSRRLEEFLPLIAEARHMASYEGLGDDAGLLDAMVNGEVENGDLSLTATAFLALAFEFAKDVAMRVQSLLDEVSWGAASRELWVLSCLHPFFDEPKHDLLDKELGPLVRNIWNSMRASSLRRPRDM